MAITDRLNRMASAGFDGSRPDGLAGPDEAAVTAGPAVPRTLVVVLGSVGQPYGGSETRARLTTEVFTSLGITTHVVSTYEPAPVDHPSWAASVEAPGRAPASGFSRQMVRLIRQSGAGTTAVVMTHATLLPAILAARVRQPIIWDTNECHSFHYRRLPPTAINRLKHLIWFALERWSAHRCWRAIAIGDVQAAIWKATHPILDGKVAVVDHAVLVAPPEPAEARQALRSRLAEGRTGPILLFLGTLKAKQNTAAVNLDPRAAGGRAGAADHRGPVRAGIRCSDKRAGQRGGGSRPGCGRGR